MGLSQHSLWTPHSFRIRLASGNGGYGYNWIQVCKQVKVLQKKGRAWKEEEQKISYWTGEIFHIRGRLWDSAASDHPIRKNNLFLCVTNNSNMLDK